MYKIRFGGYINKESAHNCLHNRYELKIVFI